MLLRYKLILVLIAGALITASVFILFAQPTSARSASQEFCGRSTEGQCIADSDCVMDGCNYEICRSKFESAMGSPCLWKSCYDKKLYDVECGCIQSKCKWKEKTCYGNEICKNSKDDDCNGKTDETPCNSGPCMDNDRDGYPESGSDTTNCYYKTYDCNDNPSNSGRQQSPGQGEVCDGLDNDCNGKIDEDLGTHDPIESLSSKQSYGQAAGQKQLTKGVCKFALVSCISGKWQWDYAAGASEHGWTFEPNEGGLVPSRVTCNDGVDNDCDGKLDCGTLNSCAPITWETDSEALESGWCYGYCWRLATDICSRDQGQGRGMGESGSWGVGEGGAG